MMGQEKISALSNASTTSSTKFHLNEQIERKQIFDYNCFVSVRINKIFMNF